MFKMMRRRRYLYEDVPVPRRTAYRWRKEAEREEMLRRNETESDTEDERNVERPALLQHAVLNRLPQDDNMREVPLVDQLSSDDLFSDHSDSMHTEDLPTSSSSEVDARDPIHPLNDEEAGTNSEGAHEFPSPLPPEMMNEEDGRELTNSERDENASEQHSGESDQEFYHQNERNTMLDGHLCQCTTTTEGDAFLMCLALGIRHNLSWVATVDILKFVNKLYGRDVIHASKYYLLKFFDCSKDAVKYHMFCSVCEAHLGTKDFVEEQGIVQCDCGETVNSFGTSSSFFVSVDVHEQFKRLLETPEIATEIQTHRFQRTKINNEAIEDIFDGEAYKSFSGPGQPLANANNFSVTLNTDGMDLGKSSAQSAWPIFLYINELSPKNRKKHMIFSGIWVGKKHPNMQIFLKPFAYNLKQLYTDGIKWMDANNEEQVSLIFPLLAVLDSGARYKFLNMISFHGYYGCTFCYQKAENTTKGRRFTIPETPAPVRTQESMLKDMKCAHKVRNHTDPKKRTYKGCKGLTPLVILYPYLNLALAVIVDFMHNALLGVTRTFVAYCLKTAGPSFYVGDPESLHIMNDRLKRIRPPKSITRTPRELTHAKLWKASEWRSWLLFYGLVCFDGVLRRKHLEHFALLSSAFYILLQKSILTESLKLAHVYLLRYVFLVQEYFGKLGMLYNVHLLLHVSSVVKNWGPLWAQNTFAFEGENRHLAQMHTSPGRIAVQLTRRYLTFTAFPSLCEKYASSETPLDFIKEITGQELQSFHRCNGTVLIGKGVGEVFLDAEELQCMERARVYLNQYSVYSYSKMLHNGIRYTTKSYSDGKKFDDSWIKINGSVRGFIEKILLLRSVNGSEKIVLTLRIISVERDPILRTARVIVSHIKRVSEIAGLTAISPFDILQQCLNMDLDNGHFIADLPYGCYGD